MSGHLAECFLSLKQMTLEDIPPTNLSPAAAKILRAGAVEIDPSTHRVSVSGRLVELTAKEFGLLKALMEGKGEVVSRGVLLQKVWGFKRPNQSHPRTIDVYIVRLRRKLGPEAPRILTVRNVGYRLDISLQWIRFG